MLQGMESKWLKDVLELSQETASESSRSQIKIFCLNKTFPQIVSPGRRSSFIPASNYSTMPSEIWPLAATPEPGAIVQKKISIFGRV